MQQYYFKMNDDIDNFKLEQYIYSPGRYMFNWHKEIEIMFILKGHVEVCVEGKISRLYEKDIIVINSNCGHATLQKEPGSIAAVIKIDPIFFMPYYKDADYLRFSCNSSDDSANSYVFEEMRRIMAQMCISFQKNDIAGRIMVKGLLFELIGMLIENFPPQEYSDIELSSNKANEQAMKKMVAVIESNYKKRITLDMLAKMTSYNRTYISTLFKTSVGINFYEYLVRTRLQHALFELDNKEKSVANIALDAGFPDVKSFNTYFKRQFGKTPSEYRTEISKSHYLRYNGIRQRFCSYPDAEIDKILSGYINHEENTSACKQEDTAIKEKIINEKKMEMQSLCEELMELIENI